METPVKIPFHSHLVTPSSGLAFRCYWCEVGGYITNGYHCTECDLWFHSECVKIPWEINHTSHPEHPLRQTMLPTWFMYWCKVCKRRIDNDWAYSCVTCQDYKVHFPCGREPPSLTIEHPQAHKHPLKLFSVSSDMVHLCEVCKEEVSCKLAFRCFSCKVVIHVGCVNLSEVNHPCHPRHPLKLLTQGEPDYADNACLLCGLNLEGMLYHCSICNFSVCLGCSSTPPPLEVEHLKTHEHKLTLMARQISFTCNACGTQGDRSPYFCVHCDFMVHRSCIGLPRVININRHDHRISHTQQLGFEDSVCRICLGSVSQFYGAYSCSVCVNYVVHSLCATRNDVWDGKELEGIPENTEDLTPFKKVGDNLINHFSHEKPNLKLIKDGTIHGGNIRCEACMLPVYSGVSDPTYSCEQCEFVLHEICAILPKKKRHMFHTQPFTLRVGDSPKVIPCSACGEFFNGFRYESGHVLDVSCILISDFLSHKNHEHSLHYNQAYIGKCDACHKSIETEAFSCESCDYNLDFHCASLPKTVQHLCDQHQLSLSCEENASGKYWCDICEEEMDPKKWFYSCNDCGVTTHVKCVLGDFSRLKPGSVVELREEKLEVIPNNRSTRPICTGCGQRCKSPFFLKSLGGNMFVCSERCFSVHIKVMRVSRMFVTSMRN